MIFNEVSDSIRRHSSSDSDFLYPFYEEYCISNIPGTVLDLFDVKIERKLPIELGTDTSDVNKVVLLVLDGLGYDQFLLYSKTQKFLVDLAKKSDVIPLTSVFPSQTTNALTTLNTGLTPQEHGLFEYYLYIKEVDIIVNTLSFDPLGSKRRNVLIEKGFDPKILYKGSTIQNKLRNVGIKTYAYINNDYAYSNYCTLLFEGSSIVPNLKPSDLIVNLRKNLDKENGPAYFFVHLNNLDTISHEFGPDGYEYGAELSNITHLLNKELVEKVCSKTANETLVLVTSDHGSVSINPQNTTYLNEFPQVVRNLKLGKGGRRILPTGGARDVFLHIKEDKLTEIKDLLQQKIGHKAKIFETRDAIENGLFGLGNVGGEFYDRAGNLLIVPYRNETVWFEHFKDTRLNLMGHHGGLDEKEMLLPLVITKLSNLR